jgi:hypothetical protein
VGTLGDIRLSSKWQKQQDRRARKAKPMTFDPCYENVPEDAPKPCFQKRGALCQKQEDADCCQFRYWPKGNEE